MDLKNPSVENIEYMIKGIQRKLNMANAAVLNSEAFNLNAYKDLYEIYRIVESKGNFSIREIEEIVRELGNLRGSK